MSATFLLVLLLVGLALAGGAWAFSRRSGSSRASSHARQQASPPALTRDERHPDILWARLPPGTFLMGAANEDEQALADERPRHQVTLTRAFELMTTPVTVATYRRFAVETARSMPTLPAWSGDHHPMVNLSWDDAAGVCAWLGGRLPTEAEWEFAARGGLEGARFPWGDEDPIDRANARNGARFGATGTAQAGSYASNGYGLFDMAGNVWEWVSDWYGPFHAGPETDPGGSTPGHGRVLRGGSWFGEAWNLRVVNRFYSVPTHADDRTGVRAARDVRLRRDGPISSGR